jgi:hypothetical protein
VHALASDWPVSRRATKEIVAHLTINATQRHPASVYERLSVAVLGGS